MYTYRLRVINVVALFAPGKIGMHRMNFLIREIITMCILINNKINDGSVEACMNSASMDASSNVGNKPKLLRICHQVPGVLGNRCVLAVALNSSRIQHLGIYRQLTSGESVVIKLNL